MKKIHSKSSKINPFKVYLLIEHCRMLLILIIQRNLTSQFNLFSKIVLERKIYRVYHRLRQKK